MRTIHLYGHLKKTFGATFRFDVTTAAEAMRALHTAFPDTFVDALRTGSYQIIRGRRRGGLVLELKDVTALKLGSADLHVVPVPEGSRKGAVKAILGVALIGAAIFFSGGTLAAPLLGMSSAAFTVGGMAISWGNIALFGAGLLLSGAASLYSQADETQQTNPDDAKSFSLGGPQNVYEQGNAVPLVYGGPIIIGSQPISLGFDIENIGTG